MDYELLLFPSPLRFLLTILADVQYLLCHPGRHNPEELAQAVPVFDLKQSGLPAFKAVARRARVHLRKGSYKGTAMSDDLVDIFCGDEFVGHLWGPLTNKTPTSALTAGGLAMVERWPPKHSEYLGQLVDMFSISCFK